MIDFATLLSTTSLSSPFFTPDRSFRPPKSDGIRNTLIPSSGTGSQSGMKLFQVVRSQLDRRLVLVVDQELRCRLVPSAHPGARHKPFAAEAAPGGESGTARLLAGH